MESGLVGVEGVEEEVRYIFLGLVFFSCRYFVCMKCLRWLVCVVGVNGGVKGGVNKGMIKEVYKGMNKGMNKKT